jgi:hypothetical protein
MANMKKPAPKVKKTQAQIDAELAASKKAFEKYKATRPSKAKLAEIYTEQQNRLGRSKTIAPKPATRRPGTAKPAPLGTAPTAPRRGNTTPAPLGAAPARPKGRITPMPKTTKKAPATTPKKQEKMTPQDAAMKKILEKRYGKIYG